MTDPVPPPRRPTPPVPAPLGVAASLAAVEGILMVLYGVAELFALEVARAVMGATTALFFLVYGAGMVLCAWRMARGVTWARSPVVMAQLIQLGVAWSFRGGDSTLVAVALAGVALLVLGGVFHPASLRALGGDDAGRGEPEAQTGG
ncbi:MAG: hypothetical protein ACLGH4_07660 [Actinomycetes bacterium]